MHPQLSVVIPVYNEEDVLPLLVERLRPVLDGLGAAYEVVTVDDGSTDASAVVLQRIRHEWPQIRVIRLRANAGHQAAISAGLARACGDYMVTIDADLQDPPEVIAEMYRLATDAHVDVVYGVRNDRSTDTAFKRGTARAFYATMRALSPTDAPVDAGDFRLMSRATVDAVNALPEHHRVLRLAVPALGFPSATVTYRREERAAGTSKYPLSKMIKLSLDSLTSHSMAPLRLATWTGLLGGAFALLILAYALTSLFTGRAVAGWTSTVAAVSSVGAVQLICLGLLGEYVGRMYTMMQGRPTYFVAHDTNELATRRRDPSASEAGDELAGLGYVDDAVELRPDEPVADPTDKPRRAADSGLTTGPDQARTAVPARRTGGATRADRPVEGVSSVDAAVIGTDATAQTLAFPTVPAAPTARPTSDDGPLTNPVATATPHEGEDPTPPAGDDPTAPVSGGGDGHRRRPTMRTGTRRRDDAQPADAPVLDAEGRQAVRRTSASKVTPGSDLTGR